MSECTFMPNAREKEKRNRQLEDLSESKSSKSQ